MAPLAESRELCALDQVRRMLAEAGSFDEIKAIRDKAEAVRQYAKSATLGLELQNQAAQVKLLAERKAGELLRSMRLRGGDRKSATHAEGITLKGLGMSQNQSVRWQMEASVPEELFEQYVRGATAQGKELTSARLVRIARSCRSSQACDPAGEEPFEHVSRALRSMANQGKRFACIYALPPWSGENPAGRTPYREIVAGLAKLPVASVVQEIAHAHLWVIPEAFLDGARILSAWGFRYETFLVWVKRPLGFGRYWRPAHEAMLLGVRGDLAFRDCSSPSWIDGQQGPPADRRRFVRQMIERVSPGPYLDLFGCSAEAGWTMPGGETGGK